ncbi:glycosyltransferase family 4 protein [Olivibacter domesticus]|uniref:Glycosyltransferase involved in cell wall bisynthesis n=1 Tax=Olivibacter domesticus TaxID=407022 RepID=A0A1H7KP74_OLID1|nr:glycosyltransferase family 4 protein [Olivibacter domesticus]SEK88663.1 Glycosyltransferase involved in cell wall bisynthesis [Olivibacter domesticus]
MKIAFIGTYAPRQCGIGSFSQNLFESIRDLTPSQASENIVIAINDPGNTYAYPPEVKFIIEQEDHDSYLKAADFINNNSIDVCIVQHEYGIFGGQNGVFILTLLHHVAIPVIVTFHTVLKKPSYNESMILKEIVRAAEKVVVMTNKAVEMLRELYEVPAEKIEMIPHGVPDIRYDRTMVRQELGLTGKHVLLTFGFIGRNKGIETAISALPNVVEEYPDTIYIILGKTHPNVVRHAGEEYRLFLHRLVKKLNLEDHVIFLNQYASQNDLFKYLSASDIYLTPYLHEAQITSGTLSYAVGVGSAVVSTPYWHAVELLDGGRGKLFNFNGEQQLSDILMDLLAHPKKLESMRHCAREYGKTITWPKTGGGYYALAKYLAENTPKLVIKKDPALDLNVLPPLRLDHIERLTDSAGIFQHATYGIPNYHEGYCLDDNARALLMMLMAYRRTKSERAIKYIAIYLGYINYAQNADGTFRNFMGFNRNFLDKVSSEDAFGRAIWALGYAMAHSPMDAYYQMARQLFFKAMPQFEKLQSIRSIANTIIGLYYYLQDNPSDEGMIELTRKLATRLHTEYQIHRKDGWHWYESLLAYDNALLPLAMLYAAEISTNKTFEETAFESMAFLASHTLQKGHLSLIGNQNWYRKAEIPSPFAQQPIDAMAMVLLYLQAYVYSGEPRYLSLLYTSFMWFLGENDLRISLYDFETHGCCDGLQADGVNRNQGAESTLAYIISYLAVQHTFEKPYCKFIQDESRNISTDSLAYPST